MWQWESPGPEGCLSHCQSPKEEKKVGGTSEVGETHKVNKICQELCLGSERRKCQQHKKYINMHPYINTNIHQHICICSSKSFLRQRKARSTNKRHNLLALSSPQLWAISAFQAKYVLIFKAKFPQRVFFHVKVFSCGFICQRGEFSLQGLQRMNKSRCWGQLTVFRRVRAAIIESQWLFGVWWGRDPIRQFRGRKIMCAAAAWIEPMTNPWTSQQSEQSQWWFSLITALVLHWCIWHGSSPKLVEMFHWERGEDESLDIQYLLSRTSFYPLCILIIKNA